MEPAYDTDSYPQSVDWRDVGAVRDVQAQGNYGACWAITAVETVESAVFINTGTLNVLSETELIVCAEECQMCAGGWPQDAFEYIMEHNGVPLLSDMSYNGDWLLQISQSVSGESDELNSNTVKAYQEATCPYGGGGGSHDSGSGSGDKQEQDYYDAYDSYSSKYTVNNFDRYGSIEGYGYATEKCTCYTDGSGCDCDSQDEGYAIRNLATYGPAVVCLDASTWQDYSYGIITSDSGCSQSFMDVNHCVQAVGYAYYSDSDNKNNNNNAEGASGSGDQGSGSGDQGSGSGDRGGGSGDSSDNNRQGYWIIRNQWSKYWGMSGYAYVAMGANTCGILNDMIQVYT